MEEKKHAIILNMIWSVLAVCINYLMNFLLAPYVTNRIGVEAYGYVSLAYTFITYIDLFSISINAFAGRFISVAYHKGDKEKANWYFYSTIIADLSLSILVLLLSAGIIWKLEDILHIPAALTTDVKLLFGMVLIKYLFSVVRTAFDTSTFILNRLDLAEKRQSAAYFIQAGVLFAMALLLPARVWYVGFAAAVSGAYLLVANMRLSRKLTPDLKCEKKNWSVRAVKEICLTGLWTSLNNMGNVLNSGLDLLFVNQMLNATLLGEISIAKNIASICYTIVLKLGGAYKPKLLLLYAEEDKDRLLQMLKRGMKTTGTFCLVVICSFFVCGYDFLQLWLPGQNTVFLFRATIIVLLGDIAIGVVSPLYYVFTLTKKVKLPSVITILMGVTNVTSMYMLIRFTALGGYAVILTTLVINCVHFIDTPLYAAYTLKSRFFTFYPVIFRYLLLGGLGMAIGVGFRHLLPEAGSWLALLGKGLLTGLFYLGMMGLGMFWEWGGKRRRV